MKKKISKNVKGAIETQNKEQVKEKLIKKQSGWQQIN